MKEMLFNQNQLALMARQPGRGRYVVTTHSPVGQRVGSVGPHDLPVSWLAAHDALQEDLDVLQEMSSSARSIILQADDVAAQGISLAVSFGEHLYRRRRSHQTELAERACIVSPTAPRLQDDEIRIPHLLTTVEGGRAKDAVLWELFPYSVAKEWLGAELPDQNLIEDNLLGILCIRAALRHGLLPDTPDYRELRRRLQAGRCLSMLFVYQNVELFEPLFSQQLLYEPQSEKRAAS